MQKSSRLLSCSSDYLSQRRRFCKVFAHLSSRRTGLYQLRRELQSVMEESNVLWWVFGESSRDRGRRWSEYSVGQTAVMAGKELADLTRMPPGPPASGALLDKVIKLACAKPPAQV